MSAPSSGGSGRIADDDLFVLTLLGLFGLGGAAAGAAILWGRALAWLLEHGILIAAAQRPLVALPQSNGAGLDTPRLALVAAAALLLIAAGVGSLRRWLRRRQQLRAGELA